MQDGFDLCPDIDRHPFSPSKSRRGDKPGEAWDKLGCKWESERMEMGNSFFLLHVCKTRRGQGESRAVCRKAHLALAELLGCKKRSDLYLEAEKIRE